jgi:subtilisin family serine protease
MNVLSKSMALLLATICLSSDPWLSGSFKARAMNEAHARVSARKEPHAKVAPDLAEIIRKSKGKKRQRVIVQLSEDAAVDSVAISGGPASRDFKRLRMRTIDVSLNDVETLAARWDIKYVSPDRELGSFGHIETTTGTSAIRVQTDVSPLGTTTSTVYDGTGIGIAIVDSGIDAQHTSLKDKFGVSRVIASRDFTGENRTDDPFGHGTHVASIAAGNDQISSGAYTGIAPNAKLINLRVLNSTGAGAVSSVLAALDWIMTNREAFSIRVVNLSIGTPAIDSFTDDPLCQAVRRLTDAGVIVIAAPGNNGKDSNGGKVYGLIHSPGNEPSALTVGAANTLGTDVRSDDGVTTYSSRGPTRSFWTDDSGVKHYDNLLKPELVAPGNKVVGAASPNNWILTNHSELDANVSNVPSQRMMYLSGSSMAAPVAAGAAALLLQANTNLNPSLAKAILMYTAQPLLGFNTLEQGAGEINVEGAIRLARAMRSDLSPSTTLGAQLINGPTPTQETSVSGQTFVWSRGIVLGHCYVTSDDLITKYQAIYGQGLVLTDGVIETSSTQSIDPTRMTTGVMLGTAVLTSNGASLSEGTSFLDLSFLLGDGVMLSDGIMIGDGIMVSDETVMGDGIMVGDSTLSSPGGDATGCMR